MWSRRRRYAIDNGRILLVDLDAGNERSDQLPSMEPIQVVEPSSNAIGKLRQSADDRGELGRLHEYSFGLVKVFLCASNPRTHTFAACDEVVQLQRASLVGIAKSTQNLLLRNEHSFRVVALDTQFGHSAVAGSAARPLVEDTRRILQQKAHGIPNVAVELVDAHLRIVAHRAHRRSGTRRCRRNDSRRTVWVCPS